MNEHTTIDHLGVYKVLRAAGQVEQVLGLGEKRFKKEAEGPDMFSGLRSFTA